MRAVLIVGSIGLMFAAMAGAEAAEENDLRDFRVGMQVSELPRDGYARFACGAPRWTRLVGWQDYQKCPSDDAGLHEVHFQYDDSDARAAVDDDYEGTKIGGHPVFLSLLISAAGRVEGIRIRTDPSARLYLKKKAHLFGPQAMRRYGEEGWSCASLEPGANEEPVGGVFVKERCEKTTATRRFILNRELFRRTGRPLKYFESNTELAIMLKEG